MTQHVDDLLKKPAAMKAEILRLRSECQRLRAQLGRAEERAADAQRNAESAWQLLKDLRGTRC